MAVPFPGDRDFNPFEESGSSRYNPMNIPIHIWRSLPEGTRREFLYAYEQHGKDPGFREYVLRKSKHIYEDAVLKGKALPEIFFDEAKGMTATEVRERERHVRELMERALGKMPMPPLRTLPMPPPNATIPFERPAEVQKFDAAGIVISYEDDPKEGCIVVKLKLPTATVAGATMPDDEKKLFDALMKSRKISDQLLGLEALVRHEEVRLADAKKKEADAET